MSELENRIADLESKVDTLLQLHELIRKNTEDKLELLAPIGSVILFIGKGPIPRGFMDCDGRNLSISSYQKLFSIIGYSFNDKPYVYHDDPTAIDPPVTSSQYFQLPNMANAMPIGAGTYAHKTRNVGDSFGFDDTAFVTRETPVQPLISHASMLDFSPTNPPSMYAHPENLSDLSQRPSLVFRFIVRVE